MRFQQSIRLLDQPPVSSSPGARAIITSSGPGTSYLRGQTTGGRPDYSFDAGTA